MFHYRIRGIFSTALTKMLLDAGHCISKPSLPIKNRFQNLPCDETVPPDAYILDNDTRTGFSCRGDVAAVESLERLLREKLEFPFIIKPSINPNTIIKAKVLTVTPREIRLSLGNDSIGIMKRFNTRHELHEGDELLVSVKRQLRPTRKIFEVSLALNVIGKTATLITHRQSPIYSRFLSKEKRKLLQKLELSFDEFPVPCTVRWRSAAEDANTDELLAEVTELKETLKQILDKTENSQVGESLYQGTGDIQVFLGAADKNRLDAIRRQVTPTVFGHHVWKGLNPPIADFVAYMETILSEDSSLEQVLSNSFQRFVMEKLQESETITIFHWKPSGQYYKMGPFKVEEITSDAIFLKRIVRSSGVYDGLNVEKELGDVIRTIIPRNGAWWIKHAYFSSEGKLKGEYYNINTPPEFAFNNIRYFDLIVDVVRKPSSSLEIIDVEELDQLVKQNLLTSEMKDRILQLAEDLEQKILLGMIP